MTHGILPIMEAQMGAYVFNNQIFDSWLKRMSDEILSKVNREKITTEEMIILILKAQTNHFHHMDIDMKEDMLIQKSELSNGLQALRSDMQAQKEDLKKDINSLRSDVQKDISSLRSDVQKDIGSLRSDMHEQKIELKNDMNALRADVKAEINKLDSKMDSRFMWSIGVTITMSLGLYIKLFLG